MYTTKDKLNTAIDDLLRAIKHSERIRYPDNTDINASIFQQLSVHDTTFSFTHTPKKRRRGGTKYYLTYKKQIENFNCLYVNTILEKNLNISSAVNNSKFYVNDSVMMQAEPQQWSMHIDTDTKFRALHVVLKEEKDRSALSAHYNLIKGEQVDEMYSNRVIIKEGTDDTLLLYHKQTQKFSTLVKRADTVFQHYFNSGDDNDNNFDQNTLTETTYEDFNTWKTAYPNNAAKEYKYYYNSTNVVSKYCSRFQECLAWVKTKNCWRFDFICS